MKNLDIKISEKVAQEASKTINDLRNEIERDKDINIRFLKDVIYDIRQANQLQRIMVYIMSLLIALCIIALSTVSIVMFNGFTKYVSETLIEYNCEIDTKEHSINSGNIHIRLNEEEENGREIKSE